MMMLTVIFRPLFRSKMIDCQVFLHVRCFQSCIKLLEYVISPTLLLLRYRKPDLIGDHKNDAISCKSNRSVQDNYPYPSALQCNNPSKIFLFAFLHHLYVFASLHQCLTKFNDLPWWGYTKFSDLPMKGTLSKECQFRCVVIWMKLSYFLDS